MKKFIILLILFGFCYPKILAQNYDMETYQDNEPRKIFMNSHDPISNRFQKNLFTNRKQIGNTLLILPGEQVYLLLKSSRSSIRLLQV